MSQKSYDREDGLKKIWPTFSIDVGGITSEPYEAMSVNPSPQIRKVFKTTAIVIPMYVVPRGMLYKINKFWYDSFSAQAEQDLIIRLRVGNQNSFNSGRIDPTTATVSQVTETRLSNILGAPLTILSLTGGTGVHDNFSPDSRIFGLLAEGNAVEFTVQNQSNVYNHVIRVHLSGWAFPLRGRTKLEILEGVV